MLVLASGAAWESDALDRLREASGIVVLKRCVDVDDLLASAATQQADVAVVSSDAPGLDGSTVQALRRHGVGVVAVTGTHLREDAEARLARVGVLAAVPETDLTSLPGALLALADHEAAVPAPRTPLADAPGAGDAGGAPRPAEPGRVTVVWGPVGAPGRTTVATAIASELARRSRATVLVDADPHASVAQHLGVQDQVSGLLSAARTASPVQAERLAAAARGVDDHLALLTGLPRPERQVELRDGVLGEILTELALTCDVVVDTGADLLAPHGLRDGVAGLTLEALESADEVVVVGAADPVGLARLARGLVQLREGWSDTPVRVVVNRMRPSLGWSRADVAAMVEGFASVSSLHFLPDDRQAVDRALVAARSVAHEEGSALAGGVRELVDALHPDTYRAQPRGAGWPRLRRRTAGTVRQR
ncbi:AAA family ATPase [Nocardioides daphniae]|uniref:Chromosome partitioning protein n=1 Tax=Nocardioides daphniae TaxID=402297 RepID=A0A4P7U9F6_9ACTN|nr:chromosome partitioning protein [Nocardioides daphniae]QCC76690.1 chromosome partitioning protein [Nocardioides daphniae]